MTPKQMGRLGMFHIQEAILEVLLDAPAGLKPSRISPQIGILGHVDTDLALRYAVVHGALVDLKHKGLVEKVEDAPDGTWRLIGSD